MYANAYEMRMPTHYVDMNAVEMEYDGGWNWRKTIAKFAVGAACGIVVATAAVVGSPAAAIIAAGICGGLAIVACDWIDEQNW